MSVRKYTKKPVTIEAMKYEGQTPDGFVPHSVYYWKTNDNQGQNPLDEDLYLRTLEGDHKVSLGDYIIKGVKGEFYPCKPDVFDMTYDKVPETEWDGVAEALGRARG